MSEEGHEHQGFIHRGCRESEVTEVHLVNHTEQSKYYIGDIGPNGL